MHDLCTSNTVGLNPCCTHCLHQIQCTDGRDLPELSGNGRVRPLSLPLPPCTASTHPNLATSTDTLTSTLGASRAHTSIRTLPTTPKLRLSFRPRLCCWWHYSRQARPVPCAEAPQLGWPRDSAPALRFEQALIHYCTRKVRSLR